MREQVLAICQQYLPGHLRRSGGQAITKCPFHKGGNEKRPSFSINLDLGVFHCFSGSCGVSGDISYLLHLLGLPKSQIDAMLKGIAPLLEANKQNKALQKKHTFENNDPFIADPILPEALLGMYDWMPPLLQDKGFDVGLLQKMEVGFDPRLQRITYPVRDRYGNLAAVSGGAVLPGQEPKYQIYKGKRLASDGSWHGSHFGDWFDEEFPTYQPENHKFLWNFHNVYPWTKTVSDPSSTMYIAEGFKACLWLIQHGYTNSVALMGSYISDQQQYTLHQFGGTIVLALDNDEAGRSGTLRIGNLLYQPMFGKVKCLFYPEDDEKTQPDDYPESQLHEMVARVMPYMEYKQKMLKRYPQFNKYFKTKRVKNANESVSP